MPLLVMVIVMMSIMMPVMIVMMMWSRLDEGIKEEVFSKTEARHLIYRKQGRG